MTEAGLADVPDAVGAVPRRPARRRARLGGRRACSKARGRCSSRCRRSSCDRDAVPPPRRPPGIDAGRLAMLLAVLEQHAGVDTRRRRRVRERRRRRARRRAGRRPRGRARGRGRRDRSRGRDATLVAVGEVGLGGEVRAGRRSSSAGSPRRRASGSRVRVVPTARRRRDRGACSSQVVARAPTSVGEALRGG